MFFINTSFIFILLFPNLILTLWIYFLSTLFPEFEQYSFHFLLNILYFRYFYLFFDNF